MSLLFVTVVASVPVYLIVVVISWWLIRPRTRQDWGAFLLVFLAATAWLLVTLIIAFGADQAAGVSAGLDALEAALGGMR